jgi:membrane associated rhomboid family serine protease
MGIYDREYYQDGDGPRGFSFGGGQRMIVTNVVIASFIVFLGNVFANDGLRHLLPLEPDVYRRPWQCYQFLTYGFMHADIWHIGMNMFVLWMFGRVIESRFGRIEFLLFYLVAIVFAGITWIVMVNVAFAGNVAGYPSVVGASGGVTAVFILFVLYYPRQTVYLWGLLAIPAWLIGVLLIGSDILGALTGKSGNTAWQAHLGGAGFAFLYSQFHWKLSRFLPTQGRFKWKLPGRGPRLRIHHPSDDSALDEEADRLLAKVHRYGEQSLTNRERKVLEKYSRRMRDRRQ